MRRDTRVRLRARRETFMFVVQMFRSPLIIKTWSKLWSMPI